MEGTKKNTKHVARQAGQGEQMVQRRDSSVVSPPRAGPSGCCPCPDTPARMPLVAVAAPVYLTAPQACSAYASTWQGRVNREVRWALASFSARTMSGCTIDPASDGAVNLLHLPTQNNAGMIAQAPSPIPPVPKTIEELMGAREARALGLTHFEEVGGTCRKDLHGTWLCPCTLHLEALLHLVAFQRPAMTLGTL
jgi:hypothetical protein